MRSFPWLLGGAVIASFPAASAPFSAARTLTGAPFSPSGQVTLVHYWATWCVPCRQEMPILDAYYRRHHAQGLAMIAISIDESVTTKKLQDVTRNFAFPVARIDDAPDDAEVADPVGS